MAEKTKFWYLKNFNIFDGLNDEAMKKVDKMASMSSAKTHEPIYFADEPSRSIFFLKYGHVKISRLTEEGKEIILDIVGPGEIFGELSIVAPEEPRSELAVALDDVIVCAINKDTFESLMKSHPSLNFEITKRIGLRLRKFEERVTNLMFKDVRKRIAAFLVKYAEDFGKIKEGVITVKAHLSHQEIAILTGTGRQSVTTILNELRSDGLIDFSRDAIIIKEMHALQTISK